MKTIGASAEEFLAHHADPRPEPFLEDGTVVDGWRVTALLGRGGSGEVYRVAGRDCPIAPAQVAALKLLVRDTPTARARFLRERELLAKMDNPAFPRFIAKGETDGRPYVVTELLEPRTLPASDCEVADFILALCGGVATLHRIGCIHRDIKPGNILWRTAGASGTLARGRASLPDAVPVLIDLGLAKDMTRDPDASGTSMSIVDGRMAGVGTPGYAAPEQLVGDTPTPAADIHALGILANECFGGKPPPAWGRIIDRATGSIPARRYRDVAAFARAVRRRHWRSFAAVAGGILLATLAVAAVAAFCRFAAIASRRGDSSADVSEEQKEAILAAREKKAWSALCTDVATNRIARIVEDIAAADTNEFQFLSGKTFAVTPLLYNCSESTNEIRATIVDLGGRTNVFTRPIQLEAGREYVISGPGVLDAILTGPDNSRFSSERLERRRRVSEGRVERDPAAGAAYSIHALMAGDPLDDIPADGVVRLDNCLLRNRSEERWPQNGLFYILKNHSRLELPGMDEARAMFIAPYSSVDGTVDFRNGSNPGGKNK